MKKRILIKIIGCLIVSIGCLKVNSALAAGSEDQREIPVKYVNNNPEAGWQVGIMPRVEFTNDKKTSNLSVELQYKNYAPHMDPNLKVKVSLKSKNAYDLKKGNKNVDYQVKYDSVMAKNDLKQEVGILSGGLDTYRKEGIAQLVGTATEIGHYTDTLTYYVQRQ